jgi:hypothetical protein
MREERHEDRTRLSIPAACVTQGAKQHVLGRVTDISVGGARVDADVAMPFGPAVVLYIRLPGASRPLPLPAIVRWIRGGSMGLQFTGLGVRETRLIVQLASGRAKTLDEADVAWIG